MSKLLFRCYLDFCTHILNTKNITEDHKAMLLIFRHYAKQGIHPMSGGTGKNNVDHLSDYLNFRKKRFDIEHAPLPDNLELSHSDKLINKEKNWKVLPVN
jgi:hypothetical protein